MKSSEKNSCQSCGIPITRLSDFGRNKSGSIHTDYCRDCYQGGKFTDFGIKMKTENKKTIALA
ncbi:MAG: zinc ribbon domain-containing protein [Saonia sp.]